MGVVLGIDVSTTATKAVVLDPSGAVLAIGASAYGFDQPHPLWSEQDPHLWWAGAIEAIGAALDAAGVGGRTTSTGVGLTGQMHGLVLLDAAGDVLRPAILWNDQRTAAECDAIRAAVGPQRLVEITGNDALTGFTAPKLAWVRAHEPEIWARVAHVLLPKDYVRYRLTGGYALDKADGSGTQLFDLAARDWSPVMLEALGIDPAWMPADVRGAGGDRRGLRGGRRGDRPARRDAGDGGRRRPGGQRGRGGRRGARPRGAVAGHVGRGVRDDRQPAVRAGGPGPRVLPRGAGTLAHDVGDALGRRQPALVPRRGRAGRARSASWSTRRRRPRPAATGCCSCRTCRASAARTPTRSPAGRSWA